MRKSKFSESRIVGILKEADAGVPVADLLRRHGVSKGAFFKWRSKYAGASTADVKRLRELEAENAKLKLRLTAQSAPTHRAARAAASAAAAHGAPRAESDVGAGFHDGHAL